MEGDSFFIGLRVKLTQQVAASRLMDWMQGYHEFDPQRMPERDKQDIRIAYERIAQPGDIATVIGVHQWPDRTDYLVEFDDGLRAIIPPAAAEFFDFGNIIVGPMPRGR